MEISEKVRFQPRPPGFGTSIFRTLIRMVDNGLYNYKIFKNCRDIKWCNLLTVDGLFGNDI